MKTGLPIHGMIRNTIFKQFIGAETLQETAPLIASLEKHGVNVILDYCVEKNKSEEDFDIATEEFIKGIYYAASKKNVPFISIKISSIARLGLLEVLNEAPRIRSGIHDHEEEMEEWNMVKKRMLRICETAANNNIRILIDAEQSWIQDPIDRLAIEMMQTFNKEKVIVYNTIQLYLKDRLRFLNILHRIGRQNNFTLGIKLVRGIYMDKEKSSAFLNNAPSPLQSDKAHTDHDYNAAINYCIDNFEEISCIIASQNEESNLLAFGLMQKIGLAVNHPHIYFAQLYGMSDNITFNLAKAGCNVSKYLPFGSIKETIPYLMRRAQENSGATGRPTKEIGLIDMELERRKKRS